MAKEIGFNGLSTDRFGSGSSSGSSDDFFEVGKVVQESISKITLLADAKTNEMLQRLDKDYKAFAKGIQSALNDTSYFREGVKAVDPRSGKSYMEYYVQTSELENAMSAVRYLKSKLDAQNVIYETRPPQQMDYITGTRTFEGRQAQAKALYEISRKGGKLLPSPTADNPDLYTYMLPFGSDWARGVAEDDYLNFIFSDSDALSKLEHNKRATEAEVDRNYAKAKKADMMKKLSLSQTKEAGGVWDKFEQEQKQMELASMKDNYALAKQMQLMDSLSLSQAKEAGGVWDDFEAEEDRKHQKDLEANYQANKRIKRENAQKDADERRAQEKRQREEEQKKARESLASKAVTAFALSKIVGMFTVLLDLTRRILANGLAMASDAKRTEREARNIGSTYGAMLQYNYSDMALGLQEGTTPNALFTIQKLFGNTANIDEKALGKLALVMGNSVGDFVLSGQGGKNPEKLMEMIIDAFLKAQSEGVNQFGQQVGKEEARRALYTLLSEVSPEIATIFSRAVEANMYGVNKGRVNSYQDLLNANRRIQGELGDSDLASFTTLGEVIDQLKAKFENLKNMITENFIINLGGVIDRINNANWGKNEVEQLTGKQEVLDKIAGRRKKLVADRETQEGMVLATLQSQFELDDDVTLQELIDDANESPSLYGSLGYTPKQIERKAKNKMAYNAILANNPILLGIIRSYIAKGNVLAEMQKEVETKEYPAYMASQWSDEEIERQAKNGVLPAYQPYWSDNYFGGTSEMDFWENVLQYEGLGLGYGETANEAIAYASFRTGQRPSIVRKFDSGYAEYMKAEIERAKQTGQETKELKNYREALLDAYMDNLRAKGIDIKNWKKNNKDILARPEDFLADTENEGDLFSRLAFIRLLYWGAYKGKKTTANEFYTEASTNLPYDMDSVNNYLYKRDENTLSTYFNRYIEELGNRAVGTLSEGTATVHPLGGGLFTLEFNATINGEKMETKEFKNIQLSDPNYTEGQTINVFKRLNESAESAND